MYRRIQCKYAFSVRRLMCRTRMASRTRSNSLGGASGLDLVEIAGVAQAAEDDGDLARVHRLLQVGAVAAVGLLGHPGGLRRSRPRRFGFRIELESFRARSAGSRRRPATFRVRSAGS